VVRRNSQSPVRRIRVNLTQHLLHLLGLQRPLNHPPLVHLRLRLSAAAAACCSSRLAQKRSVFGSVRLELRIRIERPLARGEERGGRWFGRGREKGRVGDEERVQLGDGWIFWRACKKEKGSVLQIQGKARLDGDCERGVPASMRFPS
jgi:hypothetical protein